MGFVARLRSPGRKAIFSPFVQPERTRVRSRRHHHRRRRSTKTAGTTFHQDSRDQLEILLEMKKKIKTRPQTQKREKKNRLRKMWGYWRRRKTRRKEIRVVNYDRLEVNSIRTRDFFFLFYSVGLLSWLLCACLEEPQRPQICLCVFGLEQEQQ